MNTVQDLINYTKKITGTDNSDVSDSDILTTLELQRDYIVEEIKSKRGEEFFSDVFYHDLVKDQYRYGGLYEMDLPDNKYPINKIHRVFVKYGDTENYKMCSIKGLMNLGEDLEKVAETQNQSEPIASLFGKDLYVFPKYAETSITDGIKLYGLITLPSITLTTPIDDVFGGRLIGEKKILIQSIKSYLYHINDNINASLQAENDFEIQLRRLLHRIGRLKQPILRELPTI